MKIKDIIIEHVDEPKAFVTGNQIDPELMELKKRAKQKKEGIDPDHAEIIQDFPV